MNFFEALKILRNGGTVRRKGWGSMFLEMASINPELIYVKRDAMDSGIPWLNTQADILSDDWFNCTPEVNLTRNDNQTQLRECPVDFTNKRFSYERESSTTIVNQGCKVYVLSYQGIKDTNDTLCIYVEAPNLVSAMEKVSSLSLPKLTDMRFVAASLTDTILLNESANLQSYEMYSVQTEDKEFICSGNGANILDLIIGFGLASYNIIGISYIDEAGKYLLIKNGK
jgi:hypothetical protein